MNSYASRRGSTSLGCLGTAGLFSMILLGACLVTDFTLTRVFHGERYALRFMFPLSVVERDLGAQRRYDDRCLSHSVEFFRKLFDEFQANNQAALNRRDLAYKPLMVLPEPSQRTEEATRRGNDQSTLHLMMTRRGAMETEDPFVTLKFPYLDWNAVPLVPVRSKRDLMKLFPDLARGMDALFDDTSGQPNELSLARFPTLPAGESELFSISLAYAIDAFGAAEKRRQAQKTATIIVFPLLIALFSFLYFWWKESLAWLPLRLFAAVYPIAMFMEITQPMCYSPARGRLPMGDVPALRNECRRVITELTKDGTLDPEMKALLEAATADPTTLRQK